MEDKKKVIIIGGGNHGIGNSVREVIALSKLENLDVQLIEFNPESKTIVEQLESLHINENILIEPIETFVQPITNKSKTKGYQQPYKFHK